MGLHENGLCNVCGVMCFLCSKYNIYRDLLFSHFKNGEDRMKNEDILGKGLTNRQLYTEN